MSSGQGDLPDPRTSDTAECDRHPKAVEPRLNNAVLDRIYHGISGTVGDLGLFVCLGLAIGLAIYEFDVNHWGFKLFVESPVVAFCISGVFLVLVLLGAHAIWGPPSHEGPRSSKRLWWLVALLPGALFSTTMGTIKLSRDALVHRWTAARTGEQRYLETQCTQRLAARLGQRVSTRQRECNDLATELAKEVNGLGHGRAQGKGPHYRLLLARHEACKVQLRQVRASALRLRRATSDRTVGRCSEQAMALRLTDPAIVKGLRFPQVARGKLSVPPPFELVAVMLGENGLGPSFWGKAALAAALEMALILLSVMFIHLPVEAVRARIRGAARGRASGSQELMETDGAERVGSGSSQAAAVRETAGPQVPPYLVDRLRTLVLELRGAADTGRDASELTPRVQEVQRSVCGLETAADEDARMVVAEAWAVQALHCLASNDPQAAVEQLRQARRHRGNLLPEESALLARAHVRAGELDEAAQAITAGEHGLPPGRRHGARPLLFWARAELAFARQAVPELAGAWRRVAPTKDPLPRERIRALYVALQVKAGTSAEAAELWYSGVGALQECASKHPDKVGSPGAALACVGAVVASGLALVDAREIKLTALTEVLKPMLVLLPAHLHPRWDESVAVLCERLREARRPRRDDLAQLASLAGQEHLVPKQDGRGTLARVLHFGRRG